jgi:hypothetical protein
MVRGLTPGERYSEGVMELRKLNEAVSESRMNIGRDTALSRTLDDTEVRTSDAGVHYPCVWSFDCERSFSRPSALVPRTIHNIHLGTSQQEHKCLPTSWWWGASW